VNADALLVTYFRQRKVAVDGSRVTVGRVYAPKCGECSGKTKNETLLGLYVCGNCGAEWPFVDVDAAAAFKRKRASKGNMTWPFMYVKPTMVKKADTRALALAEVVEVGIVLGEMEGDTYWGHAVSLWVAYVLGDATYEDLGTLANEQGWDTWRPDAGGRLWTGQKVEWAVRRARGEFTKRYLSRVGEIA
jgi:hypothetical protein